ncbi:hypothetical protein cypCar_00024816, partial [Cyprinus carpio]
LFSLIGADLFSNCTDECKALGHSDRCWMPSFVPTEARQGADYRSNLHVPGMDSVPDSEVFEGETLAGDQSFSTFGKEMPHHPNQMHQHQHQHHLNASTLERKEFDALLCNSRMPYKAACLCDAEKDMLALSEWTYQRRRDFAQLN